MKQHLQARSLRRLFIHGESTRPHFPLPTTRKFRLFKIFAEATSTPHSLGSRGSLMVLFMRLTVELLERSVDMIIHCLSQIAQEQASNAGKHAKGYCYDIDHSQRIRKGVLQSHETGAYDRGIDSWYLGEGCGVVACESSNKGGKRLSRQSSFNRGRANVFGQISVESSGQSCSIDSREDSCSNRSRRGRYSCCSSDKMVRSR